MDIKIPIALVLMFIIGLITGINIGEQKRIQCTDLGICLGNSVELTSQAKENLNKTLVNSFETGGVVKAIKDGVVVVELSNKDKEILSDIWLKVIE